MKAIVKDMIYIDKKEATKLSLQKYFYNQKRSDKVYTTIKQTDKQIKFPRNERKFKQLVHEQIEFIEKFVTKRIEHPIEIANGMSLRDYQEKTLKEIISKFKNNEHDLLIEAPTGWGKEQPYSEPVLTPLGWKTMGEIQKGDYVIGSDGQPKKVLEVFEQGEKEVYTVYFTNGAKVRCGAEHLWEVEINYKLKVMTLLDILNSNYRNFSIRLPMPINYYDDYSIPERIQKLALFLAENNSKPYWDELTERCKADLVKTARSLGIYVFDKNASVYMDFNKKSVQIERIEKEPYKEKSKCILIDSNDHLYITNDFILTHNTYFLPYLIKATKQKTLILVDLKFLQQQMYDSFKNVTSQCDIQLVDKNTDRVADVNISTLQLLRRNRNLVEMFRNEIGLVVLDEAHIAAAETISDIIQEFPAKYRIGLSATPTRSDGLDEILTDLFEHRVHSHFSSGIPITAFIIEADFMAFKGSYQETIKYLIDEYFLYQTKDIVDFFVKKKNRPMMIAVNNVETQNKLSALLSDYGTGVINGSTPKHEREEILKKYERGEINVLIGYKILNKGINIPKMQVLINLFGATTKENIEQLLGRLNRPHKDKDKAIYIDFTLPYLFHKQTTVKYKTLYKLKQKMDIKLIKTNWATFLKKIGE